MDKRDADNEDTPEFLRKLAESLENPVELNICTYEVSGSTTAFVKILCSKNIDGLDAEWLTRVFVWNISSSFCSVSEDDLEFEWKNCSEILTPDGGLEYLENVEVEGEVFFKHFKIELTVAFSSQGKEVAPESFLDNFLLNADSFLEALGDSILPEAKDMYLEIVDSNIQPFHFEVAII